MKDIMRLIVLLVIATSAGHVLVSGCLARHYAMILNALTLTFILAGQALIPSPENKRR